MYNIYEQYICIYTHTHTHTQTYMFVCVCIHIYITHTHTHTHAYTYIHTCAHLTTNQPRWGAIEERGFDILSNNDFDSHGAPQQPHVQEKMTLQKHFNTLPAASSRAVVAHPSRTLDVVK
jgi:hypothetical protein